MAIIVIVPAADNDDTDNTATTIDTCYTAVFVFDECIVCIFEYIVCCLLVPAMEDDDNIDDNDDKEEVEEMEKKL